MPTATSRPAPPTSDPLTSDPGAFAQALDALVSGHWADAQRHLTAALKHPETSLQAHYFMGVLAFRLGRESQAVTLLTQAMQSGHLPADFFGTLGRVIDGFGPEDGEALHRFLKRHRLLPRQAIGKLGADLAFANIEPWYFSARTMHSFPRKQKEFADPSRLIEKYVLPGWLPEAAPFTGESLLLTMGSCFAKELRNFLMERGMSSEWMFVPPGLNNTFAIRNFVDWCLTGNRSSDAFWYDEHLDGGAMKWEPPAEHAFYRQVLKRIDGLVLTIGLAEIWYEKATDAVFWRGVPKSIYDEEKHDCRISTVAENRENLSATIRAIKAVRPELPIIVTLSPIPLKATFQPNSCFTADCLSKSILRVAIDEVMREGHQGLHYWPSFEIVRWMGGHMDHSLFGEDGNTRHINRATVRMIMETFLKHYFVAEGSPGVNGVEADQG